MNGWLTRRDQVAVLGVRLTPLTLGHLFLLDDLDLDPDGAFNKAQLMAMVFICSQPAEEARVAIERWWMPIVSSLWMRRTRNLDLQHEIDEFCDWFNEQRMGPDTISKTQRGPDDYAAPLRESLYAVACNKFPALTESEILQKPVRKLRQMMVALGEADGTIEPWTWKHERIKRMGQRFVEAQKSTSEPTRN